MLTRYRPSNRDPHRGFGYVEFSLAEDAREAIDNMDQSELYGRVIKVNQAKPQKNANEVRRRRCSTTRHMRNPLTFYSSSYRALDLVLPSGSRKVTLANTM